MRRIVVIVSTLLLVFSVILFYGNTRVEADGSCEIQCNLVAETVLFVDNLETYYPEGDDGEDVYVGFFETKFGNEYGETYTGIKFNLTTLRSNNAPVSKATLTLKGVRTHLTRHNDETDETHGKINIHIRGTNHDDWSKSDMSRIKTPQLSDIINSETIEIDPMNPEFIEERLIEIDVTDFINSQLANSSDQFASFIVQRDLSLAVTKDFYITFSGAGSNQPTLTIERPQNTPPNLISSNTTGKEDTTLNFTEDVFLNAYTDAENDPLTYIEIASLPQAEAGKLMFRTDETNAADIIVGQTFSPNQFNSLFFVPEADFHGTTTFTWRASDGKDYSIETSTLIITIENVNDAPKINEIPNQVTNEDASITIPISVTDIDTQIEQLSFTMTSTDQSIVPDNQFTVNKLDSTITITPAADSFGIVDITISVSDGDNVASKIFSLIVKPINDAPVGKDDIIIVDEDSTYNGTLHGQDVDSHVLTYTIVSEPEKGSLTLINDKTGEFLYEPIADINGVDSFTYNIFDGELYSTDHIISITINSINDAPVFEPIADQTTAEDTPLVIPINVSDVDSIITASDINIVYSNRTLIETATIAIDHEIHILTIIPATDASGNTTVTITVTDLDGASVTQQFEVTIIPVNDIPELAAIADQITDEDKAIIVPYVASDVETDAEDLVVTVTSSNEKLFVSSDIDIDTENQQLTLTPINNAYGTTLITITATDEKGGHASHTFTVTVNAVNDLPVLASISDQLTAEDTELTIRFDANDVETSLADLQITVQSSNDALIATKGIVIDKLAQTLTFTPANNRNGTATITVTVTDEENESVTVSFTLTVNAVNDAPTLASIVDQVTDEDTDLTVQFDAGDVETTRDNLNITVTSSNEALIPTSAIVVNRTAQTLTFTPALNQNGTATFTVIVTDEDGGTAVQHFTVTVNAVNDLPQLAVIADQATDEDTELTLAFKASDVETALSDLLITATSSNEAIFESSAIVVDVTNEALILTPVQNAYGTAVITVTVQDEDGGTASQTFKVTVNTVNDAPMLVAIIDQITSENKALTVSFNASDIETALTDLNITATSNNEALIATSAIVIDKAAQTLILQPVRNASGKAIITLTVADEEGLSVSTTFEIQVRSTPSPVFEPQPTVVDQPNLSIVLDGQLDSNYAKVNIQQAGERRSATVELNTNNILSILAAGDYKAITLSIVDSFSVVNINIDGAVLEVLSKQQGSIILSTVHGSYSLDIEHLNLDGAIAALPNDIDLKSIYLSLEVSELDEQEQEQLTQLIEEDGYELISSILSYSIRLHYEDTSIEVDRFTNYLKRIITLENNIDPDKITTAVVITENGEIHHVPTVIYEVNNQYYAQINAMSNSYYGVIWSPRTFSDVEQHWSKEDVNDLASRLIINGITDSVFAPDAPITRSQFAAILIRGLGLLYENQLTKTKVLFRDVASASWYEDAVQIASSHGLITGYEDGSFKPNNTITRMEAMVMLARAMKLANLNIELDEKEGEQLRQPFSDLDKLSNWARDGVALNIKYGLIDKQAHDLNPLINITRAETASMLRKLLQKAELIN